VVRSAEELVPQWVAHLAASHPFGLDDARGTLNLIDGPARLRAAAEIRSGDSVSLCRRVQGNDYNSTPDRPGFDHSIDYRAADDGLGWGGDHLRLDAHGLQNTHIDALNHVAVGGTYYGGRPVDSPAQGSIDVLAPSGVLTRAIYVDIPTLNGTAWASEPVTGRHLEAALSSAGLVLQSGDALCLDMGRDRFEAASGHMLGGPETEDDAGGGLSSDGARWIAEHAVSILAWDMLDSREAKADHASAHVLTWAVGLLLVDNCDFGALRAVLGAGTQVAGALVLAPLPVEGANGANVNPLILR
jgi:hypothetical protein